MGTKAWRRRAAAAARPFQPRSHGGLAGAIESEMPYCEEITGNEAAEGAQHEDEEQRRQGVVEVAV